jgi:hypothetical protein
MFTISYAATTTPDDPVIAASVLSNSQLGTKVPKQIRDLLSAKSGCNDGVSFPFLQASLCMLIRSIAGGMVKKKLPSSLAIEKLSRYLFGSALAWASSTHLARKCGARQHVVIYTKVHFSAYTTRVTPLCLVPVIRLVVLPIAHLSRDTFSPAFPPSVTIRVPRPKPLLKTRIMTVPGVVWCGVQGFCLSRALLVVRDRLQVMLKYRCAEFGTPRLLKHALLLMLVFLVTWEPLSSILSECKKQCTSSKHPISTE